MLMVCENEFCIFQEKRHCTLNDIELDILGQCTQCIYVNIEEKSLAEMKKSHLKKLEER